MQESDKNIDKIIKAAEEILAGKKVSVSLEPEMLTAIKQVLAKKEIQADPNFKKSLDKNIKKALLDITKVRKSNHPLKEKAMKYFLTFLSGSFATAIIVMVVLNQLNVVDLPFNEEKTQEVEFSDEVVTEDIGELLDSEAGEVNEVSHKDFGDVPDLSDTNTQDKGDGGEEFVVMTAGKGGGGGGEAMMESRMMPPYPGGDLYPPEVNYTYSNNTEPSIPSSIPIYKTIKTEIVSARLGSLLNNFGVAAGKFIKNGKLTMQNMSFYNSSEKKNYNVDFNSGVINFYTNRDYDPDKKSPTKEDILDEDELINIANSFLKEHDIEPAILNAPEVDERWKDNYDENHPFFPSEMTVIYPRTIDGLSVVNGYNGEKVGQVRINIDVIDKQAMSGSVNLSLDMDKTEYPTQKFSTIKETLEKTGGTNALNYGPTPLRIDAPDEDLKPYIINVDYYKEATIVYIEKSQWRDGGNKIYYIPVIMFKGHASHSNDKQTVYNDQVTFVPVISAKSFQ